MNAVDSLTRVVDALDKVAIPYMVVGSFSSNIYGNPRSTKDADIVVELGDRPVSALVAEIGYDFTFDPQMSFETVTGTMRYRLKHCETAFVIELFLLSNDPMIARASLGALPATPAAGGFFSLLRTSLLRSFVGPVIARRISKTFETSLQSKPTGSIWITFGSGRINMARAQFSKN